MRLGRCWSLPDVPGALLAGIRKSSAEAEHNNRPALTDLIEALDGGVRAANEPQRVERGAPDFVLRRDGFTVGYVETKDLGKSLDEAEDSDHLTFCDWSHLLFCDTDDGQIHLRVKSGRLCRTNSFVRHG